MPKRFCPPRKSAATNEPSIVNVLTDDVEGISDRNISLREAALIAADGGTIEFDQRGERFPRVGGAAPDIGAFESK